MWSQRRKYGLYLAGVSAVGFLLSLGLKTTPGIALLAGGVPAYAALSLSGHLTGHSSAFTFWLVCFVLILCQLVLLTLPTLAALRSHAEGFWGCLLIQFIVLVLSWLAGAMLLANPG